MTTLTTPAPLRPQLARPRTTFLSLPRELRRAIILDALQQSDTYTWYNFGLRRIFIARLVYDKMVGHWYRPAVAVDEIQEAIQIADPALLRDVEWAWDTWIKTRGPRDGVWSHDCGELGLNGCRAQDFSGRCEGCSVHVQPS